MPEDVPVPEPAAEPHDEAQRHPAVHLQRMRDGVHPVAPSQAAHAHSQSRRNGLRASRSHFFHFRFRQNFMLEAAFEF